MISKYAIPVCRQNILICTIQRSICERSWMQSILARSTDWRYRLRIQGCVLLFVMCTFVFDRNAGISGAVTAIAPSPSIMMSTSLDRYARAHSVFPPLSSRDRKGEILQRFYLTGVPTAAVWDHTLTGGATAANDESAEEQDDVWDKMVHVGDDDSLNNND